MTIGIRNAICCVLPVLWMTSRFRNGANEPESKTARKFHPVREVAATGRSLQLPLLVNTSRYVYIL